MAQIDAAIQRSLVLLREKYTPSPGGGGGWYHRLGVPPPGATATAVALLAFDVAGERPDHIPESLKFLKARQLRSAELLLDGGWATNTSMNQPVVEATAWVVHCLGRLRLGLADDGPDLQSGYQWLLRNQNEDGGWGSFYRMPSRTFLTCLAIQALMQVNPYHESVPKAVRWLVESSRPIPYAWGKEPSASPTVTHTAFVLMTLCEGGYDRNDERIGKGFDWLADHLDVNSLDEPETRVEEYRVVRPGRGRLWRSPALIHYCLPMAAAALEIAPPASAEKTRQCLDDAIETIIARQNSAGYWPNIYDTDITLWGVWPCLQALAGASRISLAGRSDLVTMLPDVVVIQNARSRHKPLTVALADVLPRRRRFSARAFLRRYWAAGLLALFVLAGIVGVGLRKLGPAEVGFGLIFPIILLVIQIAYERYRA